MNTRLSQLQTQLTEAIARIPDGISPWAEAHILIGMLVDEAVRMETAAYERGMEEGRKSERPT